MLQTDAQMVAFEPFSRRFISDVYLCSSNLQDLNLMMKSQEIFIKDLLQSSILKTINLKS